MRGDLKRHRAPLRVVPATADHHPLVSVGGAPRRGLEPPTPRARQTELAVRTARRVAGFVAEREPLGRDVRGVVRRVRTLVLALTLGIQKAARRARDVSEALLPEIQEELLRFPSLFFRFVLWFVSLRSSGRRWTPPFAFVFARVFVRPIPGVGNARAFRIRRLARPRDRRVPCPRASSAPGVRHEGAVDRPIPRGDAPRGDGRGREESRD